MTKLEAKALDIDVWEYLAAHPIYRSRHSLPNRLFIKAKKSSLWSMVCEVHKTCSDCPIRNCGDLYAAYLCAKTTEARRAAAQEIVNKIKAWEVEE